ncbi:glutamate receptor ionotropic, kainate glr-3-like [Panulirus ornatus]|uniref:glutamate receptor ionotropic, kainate glr-3-like n=1 Tax=Panulirus ornatus TaxID=150431 RepID=UPI003A8B7D99
MFCLLSSYELIPPPDGVWGIKLPDGSWTGMMGQMHRQEVEMALGPFTITPQRTNICDFSIPLRHENFAILTPRPRLESDMSGFLKPFTLQVWMLILTSLLGVGIAMMCVAWAEGKVFSLATTNITARALIWVVCTLLQEYSEWLPQRDGGRLIVTTWLLASLVFMTSYSGILTAMLTLPRVTITVDSLGDLVSQSDLAWRIEAGAAMLTYLQESKDEVRQKAYREMGPTIVACLSERHAIADGKFAAICDETTMMKAMAVDFSTSGQCHLYMTQEKVMSNAMMSLAFKKDSQYLATANHLVRVLLESGLWDKWLGDQLANSSHCLRHPRLDRRDGIQPLNMEAFTGPLLVLLIGQLCYNTNACIC